MCPLSHRNLLQLPEKGCGARLHSLSILKSEQPGLGLCQKHREAGWIESGEGRAGFSGLSGVAVSSKA